MLLYTLTFESVKDFQEHNKEEVACQGNFKCELCDKVFKSDMQLSVHQKTHIKFEK